METKKRQALCFLCIFIQVSAAWALDLQKAYELAIANDPTLQQAIHEFEAAKELRPQALSKLLPTLGASAEYIHTEQEIISSDNVEFDAGKTDFPTTTYSVSLTQPVFNWEYFMGYGQAKDQVIRAMSLLKTAEQEMIINLADLYFQVLSAQDGLNAAIAEKKAADVHYQLAMVDHESGGTAITDLYDAKKRYSGVLASQIETEHLLDDAITALKEMTSEFESQVYMLKEDIEFKLPEPNNVDEWIQQAVTSNVSLQSKRKAVEIARTEVKRQKAGHYPTVDLSGRFNNNDTDGSLFGGGSEVETLEGAVSVNLPIYQGGFVSSKVREASQFLAATRQEYEKEYRAVSRLAKSSFKGLKSAIQRVNALKDAVESYELAADAKLEGYKANIWPLLPYLDDIRDLQVAKQEYARARYDYILNSLKLKQAAGTLSAEDINLLGGWFEPPKENENEDATQ